MDMSKIAYAIWPWGTETREQMEIAAKEITDIGYTRFESVKAAIYAFNLDLNAYIEVLERYALKPVSFYFHLPEKGNENEMFKGIEKEMEFVAALGIKNISLQATPCRPEVRSVENKDFELALIKKFAQVSKSFGITTCLHPHHNTWVMYEDEIDYIMQNTDADLLSLGPDTAHLIAGKCDPVAVIKRYADRVGFVHLKDLAYGGEVGSEGFAEAGMEVYSNFAELGKGDVDFHSVFKALQNVNYNGCYCVELDMPRVSNAQSAKNNLEFLKNISL